MSRELMSDLFKESSPALTLGEKSQKTYLEKLSGELIHEIVQLKKRVRDLEARGENMDRKVGENFKSMLSRMERFQAHSQRLEEYVKSVLHEVSTKVSTFAGRLTERRVSDAKVEELLDRHNQIVEKFETRLTQLQRLISEQELKLMGYKSLAEELRRQRP